MLQLFTMFLLDGHNDLALMLLMKLECQACFRIWNGSHLFRPSELRVLFDIEAWSVVIWLAMDAKDRQIIAFHIGDRSRDMVPVHGGR